jgi:hypothetical protein
MPADLSIHITGVEQVITKLGRPQGIHFLRGPMARAVLRLQRRMAVYPPVPPNSSYRRTGTLGRRWTTRITETGGGLQGVIGNNTIYAPLVQSRRFQRPVHRRTGWQTAETVTEQEARAIIDDFQRSINEVLRR